MSDDLADALAAHDRQLGAGDPPDFDGMATAARHWLAKRLEDEVRPLIDVGKYEGGYDCCGCSTYDEILDHAIRIVSGQP